MLDSILAFIQTHLMDASTLLMIETGMRLMPTSKPLSMLQGGAIIFHKIAMIFEGADNFVNKVIPQQISTPPTQGPTS